MKLSFLLLAAALVAAASLNAAETKAPKAGIESEAHSHVQPIPAEWITAPKLDEPINDHAVYHYLESAGAKLMKAGKTTADFSSQLNRRTCQLDLPPPTKRRLTPAELVKRVEMSVMVVGRFYKCERCFKQHFNIASGFLLTDSGAMATSLHVVIKGKVLGLVAMTRNGRVMAVREVLAADPLNDLVIVQLDGAGYKPLPLAPYAPQGAPVIVLSHPNQRFYTLTTGIISGYSRQQRGDRLATFMSITADFAKGSSGAPVFNEFGAVVGVVNHTQDIYYDTDDGEKGDLQMVVKNCTPAAALLDMIRPR